MLGLDAAVSRPPVVLRPCYAPPSCPLGPVMAQLWQLIGPALKLSLMPPYSFDQACDVGPCRMLSATA